MEKSNAKDILINFVKKDRIMRDYDVTTEYEQFCEEKCVAIETLIKALERSQDTLQEQNEFILDLFSDDKFSDDLKIAYADKYNKLNIEDVV